MPSFLPAFLGIGAMKAGTTWLADCLRRHPRIWMGRKELHFFDRRLNTRRIPLLGRDREARLRYAWHFLPGTLRGRVTGEVTPKYAILEPPVIRRIHTWMPSARLIMILRDPVERAWSQARHAWRRQLGRSPADAAPEELLAWFDRPAILKRSDYAGCLRNWLAVYPRDQLLVIFLEDARTGPEMVLRQVFGFLGLDPAPALAAGLPPAEPYAGESVPMPGWLRPRLAARLAGDPAGLEALIGRPVPWAR